MEPLQIVLIILVVAGIWAAVELALVLRRARSTVDTLDTTLNGINETLAETKPVIEKLDATLDDMQPALGQVEPLLKQGSIAIEALSADLIEVNGVLRDVSSVTGSMSTASGAVSGIASAATEKVHKFLNKRQGEPADPERTLTEKSASEASATAQTVEEPLEDELPVEEPKVQAKQYYTYSDGPAAAASDNAREDHHE